MLYCLGRPTPRYLRCSTPAVFTAWNAWELQTLLSYLRGLRGSLQWDLALKDMLTRMRLLFVPLINPVGVAEGCAPMVVAST